MTPRHLVTSYPRTASPPPPAERRGVITLVTSVTRRPVAGCHVSRVTCHVAGTLSPDCHRDQVPGVTTDVSHAVSHTLTSQSRVTRVTQLLLVTLCHALSRGWSHSPAGYMPLPGPAGSRVAARLSSCGARRRLLQCTHQPHIGPWRGAAAGASAACAGLKQSLHNI